MLVKIATAIKDEGVSLRALICTVAIVLWCVSVGVILRHLYAGANTGSLEWGAWPFSDWLINYGGGFVRRGLAGAMIHWAAAGKSAIPAVSAMLFCVFLLFATLLLTLGMCCKPAGKTLLLILLAPGSIVAMATSNLFYDRKELLFNASLVLVALLFVLAAKATDQLMRRRLIMVAAASAAVSSVVLPLVHEAFLFLAAPAYVAVVWTAGVAFNLTWLRRLAVAIAAMAVCQFVVAAIWHGNSQTAKAIWDTLAIEDRSLLTPAGASGTRLAVNAIEWSLKQALMLPLSIFTDGGALYWLVPLALSLGSILLLGAALGETSSGFQKPAVVWTALFATSLPAYLLGWDWGRWISILSIQSSVVFCACHVMQEWSLWRPLQFQLLEKISLPTGAVFFWVFIVVETTFHMPDCCILVSPSTGGLLHFVRTFWFP